MHQFKKPLLQIFHNRQQQQNKKRENIPEPRVIICQNVVHTLNAQNKSSQLTSRTVLSEMEEEHERTGKEWSRARILFIFGWNSCRTICVGGAVAGVHSPRRFTTAAQTKASV